MLTLETDGSGCIYWWVDADFAVHNDMRSHSGGVLSLGKGAIYGASKKQKLNTKSLTEAKLIAVDDLMSQILWTRYFLQAQGFEVNDNILFQDNQITMKLAKNGRASSRKRTCHINIRYFFITDCIKSNKISVVYCPCRICGQNFLLKATPGYVAPSIPELHYEYKQWPRKEYELFPVPTTKEIGSNTRKARH